MEEPVSSVFDNLQQEQAFVIYADPGVRFLSYLIDVGAYYLCSIFFGMVIGLILGFSGFSGDEIREFMREHVLIRLLYSYAIYFGYYMVFEGASKGRTLGKLVTRTTAVKDDLSPITWKDAILRSLSRAVPFEPFSALGGYPWHDKWSHTRVIKKQQPF